MNEQKFTGKADLYAKYRPSYPEALLAYLYDEAGFSAGCTVADIGCGTGIFAGLLLRRGSAVFGVEPNADMRAQAAEALAGYPNFTLVAAPAEATGLPDGAVDFVTAAQAFHWFDGAAFAAECRRILRPDGRVVLVWNCRDAQSELVAENDRLNAAFCPDFKGATGGRRGGADAHRDFFRDNLCEYRVFLNDLKMDEEALVGRNLSCSYAPRETDPAYVPYVTALRELFAKCSQHGVLTMPNLTECYIGKV